MSFFEILHKLILGPLELLQDVVFSFSMQMTGNPGLSIAFLSLAISLLVMPLYKRADAIQREEQRIAKELKPGIDLIKKYYSGDQRFMILQTYYRQNNYKPYYVLRGSLSLLLQIPFFMAAYNFLSGLNVLHGAGFGPITNLAAPDGILKMGDVVINLLPFLMTAINLLSGAVYSMGMPLKNKIQLYGMALVFLVLLYHSPSGLVLYWTLNNLFSLVKNLFHKVPNKEKIFQYGCSIIGAVLGIWIALHFNSFGSKKSITGIAIALFMQIPLILKLLKNKHKGKSKKKDEIFRIQRTTFFVSCLLLTVLTGLLIPSAVIHASPAEFVDMNHFRSPLVYVLHAFLLAVGTFLIWSVIYYLLADKSRRSAFALIFAILAITAVTNYMFFGGDYGNMSSEYVYDSAIYGRITLAQKAVNAGVLFVLALFLYFLWKKKAIIVKMVCILTCIVLFGMSVVNIVSIQNQIPEIKRLADQQNTDENDIIHLDKTGKNVIVFMLDRGIGYYMPYIFHEKPELRTQFEGFTCYTNTLSYGIKTNVGTPPLFGGYEYVPRKMDQRSDVLLKDKQNEALKVMPLLFRENGFEVTVCDPPYANYQWIPDLSIYDEYPDIRTFVTEGRFADESEEGIKKRNTAKERNLFCYSIFRSSPLVIHSELYDGGNYNKTDSTRKDYVFIDRYTILNNLSQMTVVRDDGENRFLMFTNRMTHDPISLQEPEYVPRDIIDNTQYDLEHEYRVSAEGNTIQIATGEQKAHYQTNMAALLLMGKWLDYLRDNDLYDNTRIIIVGDHGNDCGYSEMWNNELPLNVGGFNPLFLVKDFEDQDDFRFSDEFMTNADTPVIAFSGMIDNPINPFTNQQITNVDKNKAEQEVCISPWDVLVNNGYTFMDTHYYSVDKQDILNPANWKDSN